MRFFTAVSVAASAACVLAANITVLVGNNGGLTYEPTSIQAQIGDTIQFQFMAKNHTVTQSTFANPCQQMTTPNLGIDSGFIPVAAGATSFPQWSFTVNNVTAPLWFFCAQGNHCQQGMVFAVNPSADKTFAAFQAAAQASTPGVPALAPPTPGSPVSPSGFSSSVIGATPSLVPNVATPTPLPSNAAASSLGRNTAGVLAIIALAFGIAT